MILFLGVKLMLVREACWVKTAVWRSQALVALVDNLISRGITVMQFKS